MDKVILLLFAVFAVFQVQAAPELYNRLSRDPALRDLFYELENQPRERVSNDVFDEPAMSRERLLDDLYSSELRQRDLGGCKDQYPVFCRRFASHCDWEAQRFHSNANLDKLNAWCCQTCRERLRK